MDHQFVMQRVSIFKKLGLGSVFPYFQSWVRVLPCRISGFGRVSNSLKKRHILGEKSISFQVVQNFENFFKLLTIISLEKWFHSGLKIGSCKNALKFIGYIGPIYQKITNFSSHKNPSGFVGFHSRVRVFSGFSSKVGFGFRSGKNS